MCIVVRLTVLSKAKQSKAKQRGEVITLVSGFSLAREKEWLYVQSSGRAYMYQSDVVDF